ncbi:AGE family epimerase/isomerase [Cesiribacter andamanensis]|uniref:N-acylglucosamine 2-epimerase (GlcNAc 2-epimerase) n=1 Tax=Cesiribacter andamanensis AMV16 TaxID=1279009 RepID=M7N5Q7_9BACT|nr:AGE family epimerase/isomerase [Cesiribacter andamanensis]EMR02566.1 N-acylglucosamine 2-epimerase (GlcNAc 2-epimerase) [Cesiribacter andamanensis AMV16]
MKDYTELYKQELLQHVVPFWLKHSKDESCGGYFTCLDRWGNVFDTDKFVWLQGRELWLFSMLCDKVERRQEWLQMAGHGAKFLKKWGRDEQGNWYFSLTRSGKPLLQPYNIFSDCFAAMGFGTYYKVNPQEEWAQIARDTFSNILMRRQNPKGSYSKLYPGTRDLKNFSLPMILCNLSLELEHLLDKETIDSLVEEVIHEVMEVFYQPETGLILENVYSDGSFSDSFEGRLINPGHGLEAMWFIMDLGVRRNDAALISKAVHIALRIVEWGWDTEFGGLFYFRDIKGHPPQQLEWDQKLWWVHLETLVCLAKAYELTGNENAQMWFRKVHDWSWNHFRDSQYDEWFGYLNRRGEVLLPLKGGKWKGCFHVPRAMFQVWKTLEKLPQALETK